MMSELEKKIENKVKELLDAYKNGSKFQTSLFYQWSMAEDWKDIKAKDIPFDNLEELVKRLNMNINLYRVKPLTPKQAKYVPYSNYDEFLNDQKLHGEYIVPINSCRMNEDYIPYINCNNVVNIDFRDFTSQYPSIALDQLLNEYLWKDGSYCGKKKHSNQI